jgi:CheY-like chemotaxis protein
MEPDKKSVLLYERRKLYADSVSYSINNLGVKCNVVTSDENFHGKMKTDSFSHIFISRVLFEKNKDIIMELSGDSKIVLLAEFGESIPIGDWSVLSMPVHVVFIANIFNNISERFVYNEGKEFAARFTAVDAKVLVVDDINTNLKVVSGLLLPYEMEIDLCTSGAEAINAVQLNDYDLVFMDHKMPEMDGVETTQHIRAWEAEKKRDRLPVVALTANAVSGMREMFLQNGFDDFLSKPIDTVMLNAILKKWVPKEKQADSALESGKTKSPHLPVIEIEGVAV